jgi:hypothetical protein
VNDEFGNGVIGISSVKFSILLCTTGVQKISNLQKSSLETYSKSKTTFEIIFDAFF